MSALVRFVSVEPTAADPGAIFCEVAFLHPIDSDFIFAVYRRESNNHTHTGDQKFILAQLQNHC